MTERRKKSRPTPLGDKLRVFAAGYHATGQTERAEGLLQAADAADGEPGHIVPVVAADPLERLRQHGHAFVDGLVELLGTIGRPIVLDVPPPQRAHSPLIDPPRSTPVDLTLYALGLLRVLVSRRGHGLTPKQLSILSGRSIRSSEFTRRLGELVKGGFAQRKGGLLHATAAAEQEVGPVEPMPTGSLLALHWLAKLPAYERKLLEVFLARYPATVSVIELADASGYSESSSSFTSSLSELKKLGLIERMRASAELVDKPELAFG